MANSGGCFRLTPPGREKSPGLWNKARGRRLASAVSDPEFSTLVETHYEALYRFALSLGRDPDEAWDLTQQTFLRWAEKGHQLRDRTKAKTWLFTTLHREFLGGRRRQVRFPHTSIEDSEMELPAVSPDTVRVMDGATVMEALLEVPELDRGPLMLFYQEQHSYQEIAEILDVPIGTVMSRLSRGKVELRRRLDARVKPAAGGAEPVVPVKFNETRRTSL
jgi:RNA polymerase sigma factor (sigma-70 family)